MEHMELEAARSARSAGFTLGDNGQMADVRPREIATLRIFAQSVCELLRNERLLQVLPTERTLVAELACYMKSAFKGWDVNVEWERQGQDIKKAPGKISPDLVVHRIGKQRNRLVVEVKRHPVTAKGRANDDRKIRKMTDRSGSFGYWLGINLVIDVDNTRVVESIVYRNGHRDDECSEALLACINAPRSPS